jgi:uncharacterized metal-binding protein YceD (DUF177 family)
MSLRINLLDIGEEGHTFEYGRGDEPELDKVVNEVVEGLGDFHVKVNILPAGDIYVAQGDFTLQRQDECSLCAADITTPIKNKFSEYLMKAPSGEELKGHAPHNGLNLESTQEVTFVPGNVFDMADFIREQFAFSVSPYPKCLEVKECEERQAENKKYYEDKHKIGHPAFATLKNLKKN